MLWYCFFGYLSVGFLCLCQDMLLSSNTAKKVRRYLKDILLNVRKDYYTFWPQSACVILSLVCIVYTFSKVEIRKRHILNFIGSASLELFLVQGLRLLLFNDTVVRPGWMLVVWSIFIVVVAIVINKFSTWIVGKILRKMRA